jgi:hypothetical protein
MDRKPRIDKSQEGTAKPTRKSGKAGPRPWEVSRYTHEKPRDDHRKSHGDPSLEFALQSHSQHPDSDLIPFDSDPQSLHPAVGLGAMPDLSARGPFASDQGTLAGEWPAASEWSAFNEKNPPNTEQQREYKQRMDASVNDYFFGS